MELDTPQSLGSRGNLICPLRKSLVRSRPSMVAGVVGLSLAVMVGCRVQPPLTAQEQEGKHLYSVRCAHCHEEYDLSLKNIPPDLHHIFDRGAFPSGVPATDANLRRAVLAGKGMMPSFAGRFTEEQMADLIAYLRTGLR